MQMQSLQKFCKTCPTPIEHGVPQKEIFCKELTSQLSSSFKIFFPFQLNARDNSKPAGLKAKKKSWWDQEGEAESKGSWSRRKQWLILGQVEVSWIVVIIVNNLNRRNTR